MLPALCCLGNLYLHSNIGIKTPKGKLWFSLLNQGLLPAWTNVTVIILVLALLETNDQLVSHAQILKFTASLNLFLWLVWTDKDELIVYYLASIKWTTGTEKSCIPCLRQPAN